ncbi:MAG TPA: alpha/beta hydrolase [Baekduia sp.]|jgi:pimeloyl-ACP methyl ester carboxylesterase
MSILRATAPGGDVVEAIDEGSGPTVLVVHPGGAGASSWDGVARLLTSELRVVRVQRRLYAAGATIALPHRMARDAADVLAIAALLDRPLLVGHSSGAVAALEAALVAPDAFSKMVLYEPPLATSTLVAGEAAARARAALDGGDPGGAMEIHLREIVRMPGAEVDALLALPGLRAELARYAAPQIAECEALDALGVGIARYAALDLPTVLIEGDASPAHLRARLADLAAVLPDVEEIVTLAGEGHVAHLTAPQLLADVVRRSVPRAVR